MRDYRELIYELRSPETSIRMAALEKILQVTPAPELLKLVKNYEELEWDMECKLLFERVIETITNRLKNPASSVSPGSSPAKELQNFSELTSAKKFSFLTGLTSTRLTEHSQRAPDYLKKEKDPFVSSLIIRTFGKVWPQDRWREIIDRIQGKSLSERLAALEALIKFVPEQLIQHLPPLLSARDPRVRALAIRGLAAISQPEALTHLEQLLLHPNPIYRYAALGNCLLLPFPLVKPLLIKFIAIEESEDLLQPAAHILMANPDLNVPFILRRLVANSSTQKAEFLERTILSLCVTLEESGILGSRYVEFLKKLEEWENKCEIFHFLQKFSDYAATRSQHPNPETEEMLWEQMQDLEYRTAVSEKFSISNDSNIQTLLNDLLIMGGPTKAVRPEKVIAPSAPDSPPIPTDETSAGYEEPEEEMGFLFLPVNKQIRCIACWEKSNIEEVLPFMNVLMNEPDTPIEILITLFRAATRLERKEFSARAEKLLNAPNPALLASVLEYLSFSAPQKVDFHLGSFLSSNHPRVRITAFRVLKSLDPQQAVSLLQSLLQSGDSKKQVLALSGMLHFDFPVVREMLFNFLTSDAPEDLIHQGLHIYATNPAPENLYHLFVLEKKLLPGSRKLAHSIRDQALKFLVESKMLPVETSGEMEELLTRQWDSEHAVLSQLPSKLETRHSKDGKLIAPPPKRAHDEAPKNSVLERIISWISK